MLFENVFMKNYALILAGGSGQRMKEETPKAFLKINGKYLIEYSIEKFSKHPDIHHIILVVPKEQFSLSNDLVNNLNYFKVQDIKIGGKNRFESSQIAINAITIEKAKVLIHDAARPLLTDEIISDCLNKLDEFDALNLLTPVSDTLVEISQDQVLRNLDRERIRLAQTPQSFKLKTIKKAHQKALQENTENITDDFDLVLKYKTGSTSWIEGNRMNFKITYPEDLMIAQKLLKS